MQTLTELAKRASAYVRSARQTKDAARRDQYLELAANCFTMAAKRAESLIAQDLPRMTADSPGTNSAKADSERMVC